MHNDSANKYKGCSIMKKLVKKVIVYSLLVGIAQFGLNPSILEASPRSEMQQQHNDLQSQETARHNKEMKHQGDESAKAWNDRQWQENKTHALYVRVDNERQYRNELEMQRHEKIMLRQNNESAQEWNDRQWLEIQTHEKMVRQIEADVIVMSLHL